MLFSWNNFKINNLMKKLLLTFFLLFSLTTFSQITIFEDSFESYDNFSEGAFGNWIGLDLDLLNTYVPSGMPAGVEMWDVAGDPQSFMVFNPTAAQVTNSTDACAADTEDRNFNPRTGSKYAGCWAGVPNSNDQVGVGANDDWLVSPAIQLGSAGNVLRFWIKGLSTCYGNEKYRVGIYVGNGTPTSSSDFTVISGIPILQTTTDWTERIININQTYAGQVVRFGIRCISDDRYFFMVDDFKVTATTLGVNDVLSSKFAVYPNPSNSFVTITNNDSILLSNVSFTDLNGRTVKNQDFTGVSSAEINVSDLTTGIYFMNVNTDQGMVTKKFVKN